MTTSLMRRFEEDLHAEMQRAATSSVQLLDDMLSFQINGVRPGKARPEGARPRGILCLVICDALSGEHRRALPAAAAVELAHEQFVVHQGIGVTGNRVAGNGTRIEGRWGSGQAMNAGDGLHAKARLAVTRLAEHGCDDETVLAALRMLDQACARTCEGLHMELLERESFSSIEAQVSLAELKTGSLMGCAAGMGALVAGRDDATQELAWECGSDFGVALQLQTDAAIPGDNCSGLEQEALLSLRRANESLSRLGVGASHATELERLLGVKPSAQGEGRLG